MVGNGEEAGTGDVVALMARIQTAATEGRKFVDLSLDSLRDGTRPLLHHPQTAEAASETQREANELFQQLAQAMGDTPAAAPFHDLVELGKLSDSGSAANRVRRRLLAPQERFNLELLGRLSDLHRPLTQAVHTGMHISVTARLIASVNVLLQALSDLEQGVQTWDREEAAWRSGVVILLEEVLQKLQEQCTRTADGTLVPLATQESMTELRHWAEGAMAGTTEGVMGHVRELSVAASELKNENARLMDHVTALTIRVKQAEDERAEALRAAEGMYGRVEDLSRRMAELERRPTPLTPVRSEQSADRPTGETSSAEPFPSDGSAVSIGGPDFDFLVWEDLTRGDESTISEEQKKYIPWFRDSGAPVLDAGCGRGEFLELLRSEGIDAYGIDADPSMAEHCQAKGLRVEQAELFDHLRDLPDDSLGGLFLGQVVEHIPPAALRSLTDLAFAKLRPGGAIVMETINPTCLTTFSGAFYADPTHQKPVHPKALEYFLTASGFDPMETIFSAPIPPESKLAPIREEAPLDPSVKSVVLQVERNFERLNTVLYGWANYAAAARKPTR